MVDTMVLDLAFTDEQRIYLDKLYADQPVSIMPTVSLNYVKRLTNPEDFMSPDFRFW